MDAIWNWTNSLDPDLRSLVYLAMFAAVMYGQKYLLDWAAPRRSASEASKASKTRGRYARLRRAIAFGGPEVVE